MSIFFTSSTISPFRHKIQYLICSGQDRVATIHHQGLATDHGGVVAAQEDGGVGDVLGADQATGRGALTGSFEHLLTVGEVLEGIGVHGAGRHCVDADAVGGELHCQVADH